MATKDDLARFATKGHFEERFEALCARMDTKFDRLADQREADMTADQIARLNAAEPGGYIVGGITTVPATKPAHRDDTQLVGGANRWETIEKAGQVTRQFYAGTDLVSTGAAPPPTFMKIGVRTDHTAVCWGSNAFGQLNAPDGEFISVSAGQVHRAVCGQRILLRNSG